MLRASLTFAAALLLVLVSAEAQTPDPNAPDPKTTPPEKMEKNDNGGRTSPAPAVPPSNDGSLSDRLNKSGGVIRPPVDGTPDMRVPAPVPNPNTTPVIPPPGSPGNPSPVIPK